MQLSWEALTLAATFLDKDEVFSLRQVCKYWNRILTPVLCHTLIYDPLEKDQEKHKAFLKKYGVCASKLTFGFLGLGNVFVLSNAEVNFISSSFPKLIALEYNISGDDPDKSALALLDIGIKLPRLKCLDLRGVVDQTILNLLKPLLAKLQVVSLGKTYQRDGSRYSQNNNIVHQLPYLEMPLAKELRLFDENIDGNFCNLLAQKFTCLDSLFYSREDIYKEMSLLINVKKSSISQAQVSSDQSVRFTFVFDTITSKLKPHFTDYNSIFEKIVYIRDNIFSSEEEFELGATFPPIKSFHLETSHYYWIEKFLQLCKDVQHLVLVLLKRYKDDILPDIQFTSRYLILKDDHGACCFFWASKWFPNLTDFYFNAQVDVNGDEDTEFKFQSLARFYTNHIQPASFWTRLIKSSKQLEKIMLAKEDSSFQYLQKNYSWLKIGIWSTECQTQTEVIGIYNHHKYNFYKIDI